MAQSITAPAIAAPTVTRRFARVVGELWQDKAGFFGLLVMSTLLLVALLAPLLAPYDPTAQSLSDRLLPPFWLEGGSFEHPLGSDNLGRDLLARIVYGSRVSLTVGLGVVLIAGTVGTVLGLLAGYNGGRVDSVIMRWLDTQLAFPGLLLYLVILSVIRPSLTVLIVVLPINAWMVYSLLVRGVVLSAKETPYVEAAEIVGARPRRIIFRHILPNLAAPLLTLAVLEFASAILAEAALSFLGLGIQPPSLSWGLDVAIGRDYVFNAWWLVTFPGLAIALTVLGANLFASWLRIVADPHEREKRFAAGLQATGGRGA
ncbi:MAG: ABC transporter permease [Actinomycetota bacterium]